MERPPRAESPEPGAPRPRTAALAPGPILVMGVSGAGKSSVGRALAEALGWEFLDADALHPPANIEKMRAGLPLSDVDRAPWIAALCARLRDWRARNAPGVLACSALRRRHRDQFRAAAPDLRIVHLRVPLDEARRRLRTRVGHYMPAVLAESQFEALEPPDPSEGAIEVEAAGGLERTVGEILRRLAPDGAEAAHPPEETRP